MTHTETTLRRQLAALEPTTRALDWDAAALADALGQAAALGGEFLGKLPTEAAYYGTERRPRFDAAPPREPAPLAAALAEFQEQVLPFGLNPSSGRFFGYVPGGGLPTAALGDFLAALTNRYAGVYQASPGAAELETTVVRWLADLVGFPKESAGTLQSGGSLATLTAVVAARDARPSESWGRSVVYLTQEAHHAVHKALHIAGLGHAPRREVAVDAAYRMVPQDLARLVAEDRRQGLSPWLLVASAGTVNTGAVDPLTELAALARAEDLWLHVDGAYGGLFALAPAGAARLAGLALADSLVLDPHKGLFLPYGCGAVLVRDGRRLRAAFAASGDYLADVADSSSVSPADLSPELTRHFRGLRLWLSLKVHGLDRFVRALEEKLLLARLAHEELGRIPGVERGPEPELSCVTFRLGGGDGDEATAALLQLLLARGRVHLSSTRLGGRLFLRLCVLSFRSHAADVDAALEEIRDLAPKVRTR